MWPLRLRRARNRAPPESCSLQPLSERDRIRHTSEKASYSGDGNDGHDAGTNDPENLLRRNLVQQLPEERRIPEASRRSSTSGKDSQNVFQQTIVRPGPQKHLTSSIAPSHRTFLASREPDQAVACRDLQAEHLISITRGVQTRLRNHMRRLEDVVPKRHDIWYRLRWTAQELERIRESHCTRQKSDHCDSLVGQLEKALTDARNAQHSELRARKYGMGSWPDEDLDRSRREIARADTALKEFQRLQKPRNM